MGVPLITDLQLARAMVEALRAKDPAGLEVRAWNDYIESGAPAHK